ncbi:hypothetical protein MNV49_002867 [Pseudohyphozyma bogoriensis]|nr:hypothetical protein MNV49_002867 [Pseudohyphozyma bogoriensis]
MVKLHSHFTTSGTSFAYPTSVDSPAPLGFTNKQMYILVQIWGLLIVKGNETSTNVVVALTNVNLIMFFEQRGKTLVCSQVFDQPTAGHTSIRYALAAMAFSYVPPPLAPFPPSASVLAATTVSNPRIQRNASASPPPALHLRLVHQLGKGHYGECFLTGTSGSNEPLVVKLADRREADAVAHLRHEFEVYRALERGGVDVGVVECGGLFENEEFQYVALVLGYGGMPARNAQEVDKAALLDILGKVHLAGVAHSDIRSPNILKSSTGLTLVDFGSSLLRGSLSEDEWERTVSSELFEVEELE